MRLASICGSTLARRANFFSWMTLYCSTPTRLAFSVSSRYINNGEGDAESDFSGRQGQTAMQSISKSSISRSLSGFVKIFVRAEPDSSYEDCEPASDLVNLWQRCVRYTASSDEERRPCRAFVQIKETFRINIRCPFSVGFLILLQLFLSLCSYMSSTQYTYVLDFASVFECQLFEIVFHLCLSLASFYSSCLLRHFMLH